MTIKIKGLITGNFAMYNKPYDYRVDVPCIMILEVNDSSPRPKLKISRI